jgi:hypothetical protein
MENTTSHGSSVVARISIPMGASLPGCCPAVTASLGSAILPCRHHVIVYFKTYIGTVKQINWKQFYILKNLRTLQG